jgi:hypothetical protein
VRVNEVTCLASLAMGYLRCSIGLVELDIYIERVGEKGTMRVFDASTHHASYPRDKYDAEKGRS